jgi:hypothetical protein
VPFILHRYAHVILSISITFTAELKQHLGQLLVKEYVILYLSVLQG